jgi:hypothetical protein
LPFSECKVKQLSDDPNTISLFANKIPQDKNHNNKMLFEEHWQEILVAIVKTKSTDSRGKKLVSQQISKLMRCLK